MLFHRTLWYINFVGIFLCGEVYE